MHLPANDSIPASRRVSIVLRTPALSLQINSIPVLREADLDGAELTGEGEDFQMRLLFNTHGTIELDRVSNNNRDELLVVFINDKPVAAPQLKRRIVDGILEFTPDLTREEAEKLVEGLRATIAYLKKKGS